MKKRTPLIVISDEELDLLINNADEELKKAIILIAKVGLRRNEIYALQYKDIKKDSIDVTYVAKNHMYDLEDADIMYDHRTEPITQEIAELLGDGEPESYVVSLTPIQIVRKFKQLCDRLNLHYRFIDLGKYYRKYIHQLLITQF